MLPLSIPLRGWEGIAFPGLPHDFLVIQPIPGGGLGVDQRECRKQIFQSWLSMADVPVSVFRRCRFYIQILNSQKDQESRRRVIFAVLKYFCSSEVIKKRMLRWWSGSYRAEVLSSSVILREHTSNVAGIVGQLEVWARKELTFGYPVPLNIL